jgi:hypothetical protein
MSAHHTMQRGCLDPGGNVGICGSHAILDAAADINGRHREIYDRCEVGGGGVHQPTSVSNAAEGKDPVRKFVVFEPVDKEFRHVVEPSAHCNFPALIVGATYARHNATTMRGARASELASQWRENLASTVPVLKQNATWAGA